MAEYKFTAKSEVKLTEDVSAKINAKQIGLDLSCMHKSSKDERLSTNLNNLFRFGRAEHNDSTDVTVFFRDLKNKLLHIISQHEMVIGAVAWLTDLDILRELSKKQTLLTIQKEDFLRPDMQSKMRRQDKEVLFKAYSAFKPFDGTKVGIGPFFQCADDRYKALPPIVSFGLYQAGQMYRTPRLHNKFLVFLDYDHTDKLYYPTAVWTGSLNLTQLSLHSLENAVYMRFDLKGANSIGEAYCEEAQLIYLCGEKLNWNCEWINPFMLSSK